MVSIACALVAVAGVVGSDLGLSSSGASAHSRSSSVATGPSQRPLTPSYRVFRREAVPSLNRARQAAYIEQKRRENPNDPNFARRGPTDLIFSVVVPWIDPEGCVAVARGIIRSEGLTTETARFAFFRSDNPEGPSRWRPCYCSPPPLEIAGYNLEWSRGDGFHAGSCTEPYHPLEAGPSP